MLVTPSSAYRTPAALIHARRSASTPRDAAPAVALVPAHALRSRRYAYDGLRVFAALGIVWFHVTDPGISHSIGYAGLPIFLALSFQLAVQPADHEPFSAYVRRRSQRLLLPFLFWSAFYALVIGYLRARQGLPFARPTWLGLLRGPSIHLWYLPYAFAGTLVIRLLQRLSAPAPGVWAAALGATGCALLAAHSALVAAFDPQPPFAQWWYGAPAIGIGFALGYLRNLAHRRASYSLLLATGVLAACAYAGSRSDNSTALSYGVGLGLVLAASFARIPNLPVVSRLASLTLGIYLLHPFVLIMLDGIAGPVASVTARFAVALFGAFAMSWMLQRFAFGRIVTGSGPADSVHGERRRVIP